MHRPFGGASVSPEATAFGRGHDITLIDGGCPHRFSPNLVRAGRSASGRGALKGHRCPDTPARHAETPDVDGVSLPFVASEAGTLGALPGVAPLARVRSMKRKLDPRIILGLVLLQAVLGTLTVRDVARRPAEQVRGPKLLWRVWGGTNLGGVAAYWLVGRRKATEA